MRSMVEGLFSSCHDPSTIQSSLDGPLPQPAAREELRRPPAIFSPMAKPGTVIGWKLDRGERGALLERFPPRYAEAIADHVTLRSGGESDPPPNPVEAQIVGQSDDNDSLEAMVVTINGSVDRPDGSTYHITWSLGPGRQARESNDVLREMGWSPLDESVPISLQPARF